MFFILKDKDFEMVLDITMYNENAVQKIMPVLTFPKVVNRIIEKAKSIKGVDSNIHYLSVTHYKKYKGNPAEVLPEAKHCEGNNWKIIEFTVAVKEKATHLMESIFKIYYVQIFDSVNPFYNIKLYEDEIENAINYKCDHKKMYKILHHLKETGFYIGGVRWINK